MQISVLSLVFLPLTFGYAIFRYRLMDVDLIFKRGMAYTIAAARLRRRISPPLAAWSEVRPQAVSRAPGPVGLVLAIAITALLFDPLKNWVQDYLDKFFYRKRYDYRKTLIEFGRDLNSETDLDKMLIVDYRPPLAHAVGRPVGDFPGRSRAPGPVHSGQIVRHCTHRQSRPRLLAAWSARSGRPDTYSSTIRTRPLRETPGAQRDHSPAGPELLHSLHGHEPHDRRDGSGQDDGRRFPLQRRCGAAGNAGRIHRHRYAECAPLRARWKASRRSTSG